MLLYVQLPSLTCFVSQKVRDPSQLFRNSASPNHCPRNFGVFLYHPAENHLPHIKIDT